MARVLIVGCGCRGRALAAALIADGHAVRGTTRRAERTAEIEAAGAEAAVADPDRLAGVMGAVAGVTVVCWLMGSAVGSPAVHGARLETLMERLVDTPVRGVVYEAAGSVGPALTREGATIVRRAALTWRIPVEVVEDDPAHHHRWLERTHAAVGRLLAA